MSTFSNIPGIDPSQYSIDKVARAAWTALQILEPTDSIDWAPIRSQSTVSQINPANTWKIYMFPKRFQLFSYYGEENMGNRIIEMIPKILEKKDSCFKIDVGQKERILNNTSNFVKLAKVGLIKFSTKNEA